MVHTNGKIGHFNLNDWLRKNWIYITIYVFFLYMNYTSARVGDDWEVLNWYRNGLLSTLMGVIRAITYLNGRIANNFFGSFFAYYDYLWCITAPAIFTGIIFLSNRLFGNERKLIPVSVSFLMMLWVSDGIRIETYTHLIGFVAYIPVQLLIFVYLNIIFNENTDGRLRFWRNEKLNYLSIALLALLIGLWMETITIGFFAANILLAVLAYIKNRKISPYISFGIVGSILSCAIMFGAPAHLVRLTQYSDPGVGYKQRIFINLPNLLQQLVLDNMSIFFVCFLIMVIVLITKKINSPRRVINFLCLAFPAAVVTIIIVRKILYLLNINNMMGLLHIINNVFFNKSSPLTIIYCFALLLFILVPIFLSSEKDKLLVLYCIGLVSAGIMAGAPYLGARTLIFAIYMLVSITAYFTSLIEIESYDLRKAMILVLIFTIGVQMERYLFYGKYVMETEAIRLQLIEDYRTRIMSGRTTEDDWLVLPAYKRGSVIKTANPGPSDFHMGPLKGYYHLPEDANVVIDDGFGFKAFNLIQENITVYRFEVIPLKDVLDYTYTFYVRQNKEVVYVSDKRNENFDSYHFQNTGTYNVSCILSHKTFGKKEIYASEPIIIE